MAASGTLVDADVARCQRGARAISFPPAGVEKRAPGQEVAAPAATTTGVRIASRVTSEHFPGRTPLRRRRTRRSREREGPQNCRVHRARAVRLVPSRAPHRPLNPRTLATAIACGSNLLPTGQGLRPSTTLSAIDTMVTPAPRIADTRRPSPRPSPG